MIKRKVTQEEIIATAISWDIEEVKAAIYQPSRQEGPTKVFSIEDGENYYLCAPIGKQEYPEGYGVWRLYDTVCSDGRYFIILKAKGETE